jgi:hypothetical protein
MTYGGGYGTAEYGGRDRDEPYREPQRPRQERASASDGYRDYADVKRMDRGGRHDTQVDYNARGDPDAQRPRQERSRQQSYDQEYQGNGQRMEYGRSAYQEEYGARDELFTGAQDPRGQQGMTREMDNKQLLQMGVREHQETTAAAKRAAQVCTCRYSLALI